MGKSKIAKISLEDSTGGDRLFQHHPRLAEPSAYLQQLLQQESHLPSEHLVQELQLLEHPWQLLQALSAAVAVARPSPAMSASMAPALINVFMCVVCFVQSGKDSRSISNSPHKAKSPREFPRAPKKTQFVAGAETDPDPTGAIAFGAIEADGIGAGVWEGEATGVALGSGVGVDFEVGRNSG